MRNSEDRGVGKGALKREKGDGKEGEEGVVCERERDSEKQRKTKAELVRK